MRAVQKPREIRTQDFTCPGCHDGTRTSFTRARADSNTSISVTGPSSRDR